MMDAAEEANRKERALKACDRFFHPSHNLSVHGITGTNGKTTSTYLIENLLRAAGERPAIIGTVSNRFEDYSLPVINTTPGPEELQQTMRDFLDRGATSIVIEVTSHALQQFRAWGTRFKSVSFTNLTQDHLDYHKTIEQYYQAKRRLFFDYETSFRIINNDDPWGRALASECLQASLQTSLYTYPSDVSLSARGIQTKINDIEIISPMLGAFNVHNISLAVTLGQCLGIQPHIISKAMKECLPVPGRMERVTGPNPKSEPIVIVDYAHTPDALEKALLTVKPLCRGRLTLVFGCGGNRDSIKRPLMGAIAAKLADHIIITSDNPRAENPEDIVNQIMTGLNAELTAGTGTTFFVCLDRRKAIQKAILPCTIADIVLIAGKGHENYQIIGDSQGCTQKIHFDDREEAKIALSLRN